jgi:hypothetical protein
MLRKSRALFLSRPIFLADTVPRTEKEIKICTTTTYGMVSQPKVIIKSSDVGCLKNDFTYLPKRKKTFALKLPLP